jgi:hypothetical protein
MDSSPPINEFDLLYATPRRREKPTVRLADVFISLSSSSITTVDLFDALFKYISTSIHRG